MMKSMSSHTQHFNQFSLRKMLGTRYEPVGTRFLWF